MGLNVANRTSPASRCHMLVHFSSLIIRVCIYGSDDFSCHSIGIRACSRQLSRDIQLPSSQAALRPPGPLRTGREGFPSPSSSPSNASLLETRFRNGKTLTMNPASQRPIRHYETLPGRSLLLCPRNCAPSEQSSKIVCVTIFEMTRIDVTYLCFNKLRAFLANPLILNNG